jgi:conjugal transfer pilus assembly protein TraF
MKMKPALLGLAILLALPAYALEEAPQQKNNPDTLHKFFDDKERGWYWYEQLPEEDKEKVKEIIKKNNPTVIMPEEQPTEPAKPSPPKEDEPLSTAWFKKNFQNYMNAAIDNPYDKEAMRTYLYLEKFMSDRAKAFGYQRQAAVYAEPFLDATSNRPLANFGMRSMNKQANQNKDLMLVELAKHVGIYFFYRSDNIFSLQQAPLIKALEREFGYEVKAVSLDGKALPDDLWNDFINDNGQAEALGIKQLPASYLFNPQNNTVELISEGLQSLPELEKRMLHASLRSGLITEDQLNLTRPSGLFVSPEGEVTGGYPIPSNAPQEFQDLYNKAMQAQGM